MKINEALLLFLVLLLLAKLSGKLVSSMYSWSEYSFFLLHSRGSERGIQLISGSILFAFFFFVCFVFISPAATTTMGSIYPPTNSPTNRIVYANGFEFRCNKPVNSIELYVYAELDTEYSALYCVP